jgi:HNH endonuclease/AP2 domain
LFHYDPATGDLIWRERPLSDFANKRIMKIWNTRFAGKVAGSSHHSGHWVTIDGVRYAAHRIIWRILHPAGRLPNEIDHRDRDPLNNRPKNLRAATRSQNHANARMPDRNTTGYKGVAWDSTGRGCFVAHIGYKGKSLHLGRFDTAKSAHAAYCAAATRFYGEFARYE